MTGQQRAFALSLLVGFGLAAPAAVLAQPHRPGVRVTFAALDGSGGVEAQAFLLLSSRDVRIGRDPCGGRRVRATARLARGPVRSLELEFTTARLGSVPLREACPRAHIQIELEDGTLLTEGDGEIVVEGYRWSTDGRVCGRYSLTAIRDGEAIAFRGTFSIPVP